MVEPPSRIDPDAVDVLHKRKRRKRKATPAPPSVKRWAAKAEARMIKRPLGIGVMFEPDADGVPEPVSPHDDPRSWDLQIHDACGTRSGAVVSMFIAQLTDLCGKTYDEHQREWMPSEVELNAAINILNDIGPENVTQAALAAQMVAVHIMTMKTSAQAIYHPYDVRTAAVAGKLARTFVMQAEAIQRLKGKRRPIRQNIKVTKTEIHEHRTVILQGGAENGGQPHAATKSVTPPIGGEIVQPEKCPALPCDNSGGQVVRLGRRQGRPVCRMHGAGGGGRLGEANGSYRHGGWTNEAVALRRRASSLAKAVREAIDA